MSWQDTADSVLGVQRETAAAPAQSYSKLYGDPTGPGWDAQNLVTVQSPSGAKFRVNAVAKEAFEGFLGDLEKTGYKIDPGTSGGYNFRNITGGSTLSPHAYGVAIDINPKTNPYSHDKLATDLPPNINDLAAAHGLTWGGSWNNPKDPMHFEFGRGQGQPGQDIPTTTVHAQGQAAGAPALAGTTVGVAPGVQTAVGPAGPASSMVLPGALSSEQLAKDILGEFSGEPAKAQGASLPMPVMPQAPGAGPAPVQPSAQIAGGPVAPLASPTPIGQAPQWSTLHALGSGNLLGFGPELMGAVQAIKQAGPIGAFQSGTYGSPYSQAVQQYRNAQQTFGQTNPLGSVVAPLVGSLPTTMAGLGVAGRMVGAGVNALGKALPYTADALRAATNFAGGGSQGSLGARILSGALGGAGQGAGAGLLQSHLSADPVGQQMTTGAKLGGVLGGALGPVTNSLMKILNPQIRPEVAEAAQRYSQMLGPEAQKAALRPGQITTNPLLRWLDKANVNSSHQLPEFTRQLARTMGGDTDAMTRAAFGSMRDDIGRGLDAVALRSGVQIDRPLVKALHDIEDEVVKRYSLPIPIEQEAKLQILRMTDALDHEMILAPRLKITGERYQELTRRGSYLADMVASSNPYVRQYGARIRSALDDALERGSSPDVVEELKTLRSQWKNTIVAEDLVKKAGASGVVNPQALSGQVARVYKDYGWSPPRDINTLADVGKLLPAADATGAAKVGTHSRLFNELGHMLVGGAAISAYEGHMGPATLGMGTIGGVLGMRELLQRALESNAFREHALGVAMGTKAPIQSPGLMVPAATELGNFNQHPAGGTP